jgi:hypothetical protein
MKTQTTVGSVGEQAARQLAERLLAQPALCQRVAHRLDLVERDVENGATADQVEAHVRDLTRVLAQELLQDWARSVATHATAQARAQEPGLRRRTKKKSTGGPPSAGSR